MLELNFTELICYLTIRFIDLVIMLKYDYRIFSLLLTKQYLLFFLACPFLWQIIQPEEVAKKTGLGYLHTTHCLASGEVMISSLGKPNGEGEGTIQSRGDVLLEKIGWGCASFKKHTQFKTRVQKPYPIYDQNVQNRYTNYDPKQLKKHTLWSLIHLYCPSKGVILWYAIVF